LVAPGTPSPAASPVPGVQVLGADAVGGRFLLRIPRAWNGALVVAGTRAFRTEFACDLVWSDYVLARGYAYACGNKRIPYGAVVEPAAATPDAGAAYPVPFAVPGAPPDVPFVARLGALFPRPVGPAEWDDDFVALIETARRVLATRAGAPARTYAVGLSNGGAQVRRLLERRPDLVDGGLEWAGVYWSMERNLLGYLPAFLKHARAYAASGGRDDGARAAIEAAGFPPDRLQEDAAHPSLWLDHYSNVPPYYADVTTYVFARLLDPHAPVATLADRERYRPGEPALAAIAAFAHTGRIGKPLVSIAGDADMLVTPANNAEPYRAAILRAGKGALHRQYLVRGGGHVDAFAGFGYGLQPMLPFAWAAFEHLVAVVERGAGAGEGGSLRTVSEPAEIGR